MTKEEYMEYYDVANKLATDFNLHEGATTVLDNHDSFVLALGGLFYDYLPLRGNKKSLTAAIKKISLVFSICNMLTKGYIPQHLYSAFYKTYVDAEKGNYV